MKKIWLAVTILLTIVFLIFNVRLYSTNVNSKTDIRNQLNYLQYALNQKKAGESMQSIFPEGFFFLNVLYGLCWAEFGKLETCTTEDRSIALTEASKALSSLKSEKGRNGFDEGLIPSFGVFYAGWTNYLRAKIIELGKKSGVNTYQDSLYIKNSETLSKTFSADRSPFPESYPGACWPADAFPAIASLCIHDRLYGPHYSDLILRWKSRVFTNIDQSTGLIAHSIECSSGKPTSGARGCSSALMIRFLFDIDTAVAKQQYNRFRKQFLTSLFGIPVFREYPKGMNGKGDIDAGPVVFGVGSAATIVGFGTAKCAGDASLAESMFQSFEALGVPVTMASKKRYALGVLPIGDAFLLWSRLASNSVSPVEKYQLPVTWRLMLHVLSACIVILFFLQTGIINKFLKDLKR